VQNAKPNVALYELEKKAAGNINEVRYGAMVVRKNILKTPVSVFNVDLG